MVLCAPLSIANVASLPSTDETVSAEVVLVVATSGGGALPWCEQPVTSATGATRASETNQREDNMGNPFLEMPTPLHRARHSSGPRTEWSRYFCVGSEGALSTSSLAPSLS